MITTKEKSPFVDLAIMYPEIKLDIRYATVNNFLGFPVYTHAKCFLHPDAAHALGKVQADLVRQGVQLLVFDGYRPLSVQKKMWDAIPDERYISNPAKSKGRHTRGTAVDATLLDLTGKELEMPTGFDEFNDLAHSDSIPLSKAALNHRTLLTDCMAEHGFLQYQFEWWHFDLKGWQDDIKYPAYDLAFEEVERLLKMSISG